MQQTHRSITMASETPTNADSQAAPTVNGQPQPSQQPSQPPQQQPPAEPAPIVDGPNPPAPTAPTGAEPRLATRKDISLREFLHKIDDYAPIVRAHPAVCSFL